ncbi:MAG: phage holin family protein [Candidatus Bathyarchaeia archaeon]
MFEDEKTYVFWIGLIILGLAITVLFAVIWYSITSFHPNWWKSAVPFIVAAIVFILIGLYMMKSGVGKEKKSKIQPLREEFL